MRIALLAVGLLFCLFPYTQIIPLEAYNQPYALLFCALGALPSFDHLARDFPRRDMRYLFGLAGIGLLTFIVTCMPDPNAIELKSLLSYLSPPIFALAGFAIVRSAPRVADRIAVFSAVTWLFVGAVQTFVSPSFGAQFVGQWEEAAAVVVESGRGVLGLAPEPTHYGFHLIIIASALVILRPQRILLPALCLAGVLLFARSSSAILAIGLGTMVYLLFYAGRARILLLAPIPAYFAVEALLQSGLLPDSLRLVQLIGFVFENPSLLLIADTSANMRLGGIIVGAQEIWNNAFLAFGMSNEDWIAHSQRLLSEHRWLMGLSTSGVPSGILIIIYQTGFLGMICLSGIIKSMLANHTSRKQTWFVCVLIFVFMSQYAISTPGFGMIFGFIIASLGGLRRRSSDRSASRLTLTLQPALARQS